MNMIENKIHTNYSQMTNSEKRVADYILMHEKKIPFMIISSLSKGANVGEATIFRFLKKIGYSSYKFFQFDLNQSFSQDNTSFDSIDEIYNSIIAEITSSKQTVDFVQIKKAALTLHNASHVYLCGEGYSGETAHLAKYYFSRLGLPVTLLHTATENLIKSYSIHKNEVFVIFSLTGATSSITELAIAAKKENCQIILITATKESKIDSLANISLYYANISNTSDVSLTMGQLFLVELLRQEIIQCDKDKYLNIQRKIPLSLLNR